MCEPWKVHVATNLLNLFAICKHADSEQKA